MPRPLWPRGGWPPAGWSRVAERPANDRGGEVARDRRGGLVRWAGHQGEQGSSIQGQECRHRFGWDVQAEGGVVAGREGDGAVQETVEGIGERRAAQALQPELEDRQVAVPVGGGGFEQRPGDEVDGAVARTWR